MKAPGGITAVCKYCKINCEKLLVQVSFSTVGVQEFLKLLVKKQNSIKMCK